MKRVILAVVYACLVTGAPRGALAGVAPLDLLFFGNSFTLGNDGRTVPFIVRDVAVAAGHPAPRLAMQAVGGWNLADHIAKVNSDGAGSVIATGLPSGETWDAVIVQEFSTRPTLVASIGGDRPAFRADAVALIAKVSQHSADVKPVLFETWARAPGYPYYPGTFPNASAMQLQLREGYSLARQDIGGAAEMARVGDGFELHGWDGLYNADLYHANNAGSLLAGLVIYSMVYGQYTTNVDLINLYANLGLTHAEGEAVRVTANAVVPEPAGTVWPGLIAAGLLVRPRRVPRRTGWPALSAARRIAS